MARLLTGLLALVCLAACAGAPGQKTPLRVFYLSQSVGFVHETVRRPANGLAPSELAFREMARNSGAFTVELSQDARDLTPARLADLDVLVFSTTGALPIDRETWAAVVAWIESGRGGFVGIHSAADTALDFAGGEAAWTAFIGGRFDGHPWTQGTPIGLSNLEPSHPLAVMWPDGTGYAEEIYQYAGFAPGRVRVLQSLDMGVGPLRRPYPVPVTWVRQIGEGRLFYTNLGHTPSTWDDPRFRSQVVDAIRWAGGRLDAPATPNPDVQDLAAISAYLLAEGLETSSGERLSADVVDDIRELQAVHPEKRGGDTSAWDAARGRILPR
ncbi:MAG: ThuA domain-containing protein [Alphaproteobacteria bacterium]|nr:ThuA domain-containing protein [Alphaproteobacteria bacterium]MBU2269808.1 ThuA domain-containing protein [Alphaproteobacteria bacterium]MBU2419810.1 ThuA domain-containing protein [Alphaproteobacteria bacterium]